MRKWLGRKPGGCIDGATMGRVEVLRLCRGSPIRGPGVVQGMGFGVVGWWSVHCAKKLLPKLSLMLSRLIPALTFGIRSMLSGGALGGHYAALPGPGGVPLGLSLGPAGGAPLPFIQSTATASARSTASPWPNASSIAASAADSILKA